MNNQLAYKTINAMCEQLWEHREFLLSVDANENLISWIDEDISMVGVAYLGLEPDGDYEWEISEQNINLTFEDAFKILSVRMLNSFLFDR